MILMPGVRKKWFAAALLLAPAGAHRLATPTLADGYDHGSHHASDHDRSREMLPLTLEKLALVAHAMERNHVIKQFNNCDDYEARKAKGGNCGTDPQDQNVKVHEFNDGADRMYTELYGDYCMVTWMGTDTVAGDSMQNTLVDPVVIGESCLVHRGIWKNYSGSGAGPVGLGSAPFLPILQSFIETCPAGKQLVFNGHSQGGGAAGIAHSDWAKHNPITLLFGNAAWLKLSPLQASEMCDIRPGEIWRFINSETGDNGLIKYDPVPNYGTLAWGPAAAVVAAIGPVAAAKAYAVLSAMAGYSAGGYVVLPPGTAEGDTDEQVRSAAYYGPGHPEMVLSLSNLDMIFSGDTEHPATGTAHETSAYKQKIEDLKRRTEAEGLAKLDVEGFPDGTQCHEDALCRSARNNGGGACHPQTNTCVDRMGRDGDPCHWNADCDSGRCEWGLSSRCYPRLPKGAWCNEHSDCQNGQCTWRWKCN